MLRIECPWCGVRDETEFRYRGDASRSPPAATASLAEFCAQTYTRENPRGWHLEWWLHVGGCRKLLKVVRHTDTHEIHAVGHPHEALAVPMETRAP
ncbi:MAG TPA: sarcosine oxidase subunit delta [Steroidobacteraceae bacterium]|nr:sarcosine oxidase subunit delta [Steroidobacteraceae bacterium]